jgi:hypothetical protein
LHEVPDLDSDLKLSITNRPMLQGNQNQLPILNLLSLKGFDPWASTDAPHS